MLCAKFGHSLESSHSVRTPGQSSSSPAAPLDGETGPLRTQGTSLAAAALHVVLQHDLSVDRRGAPHPDRRRFVATTQELQLVSVWLSQTCRTVAGCHATIARGTPRRLWCPLSTRRITRGQRRRSGSLDGSPRLPPRRLTSVTWEKTIRELGQAQEVLSELENLEWGRMFNERLDVVVWPPKVKRGKAPYTCRTIPSLSKGGGRAQKSRHPPQPPSQISNDQAAWGMGTEIVGR
ncbi:unnamed protein product [Ectocarpus sp. 8 AP-2014]